MALRLAEEPGGGMTDGSVEWALTLATMPLTHFMLMARRRSGSESLCAEEACRRTTWGVETPNPGSGGRRKFSSFSNDASPIAES